jgi:16S rRNA (guanine527-N7)-methyltransferase
MSISNPSGKGTTMSKPEDQANMKRLVDSARQMGILLTEKQVDQFRRYQDLLLDWNQRMNLTAVRKPEQIQQRHFLDSLSCSLATGDLNGYSLVDVGSGAGFPGLPLKILYPGLRLTLVESVGKKATFLEALVEGLELANVQIVTRRAEEIGQAVGYREVYDWAVARAVARMAVLAEYLLPLVRLGGYVLAQKGRHAEEEMREAEDGIAVLGGGLPRILAVQAPGQEEPSNLVLIEKLNPTPEKYPRRAGIPAKRPL